MTSKWLGNIVVVSLVFAVVIAVPNKVRATCSAQADCKSYCDNCADPSQCSYSCQKVSGAVVGSCYSTCDAGSTVTKCTAWTGWGTCSSGYQTRYCTSPAGNNDMQISACSATPTPAPSGGGGSTPRPSATPACVPSDPTVPALSLPANGADTGSLSTTLSWTAPTSWGIGWIAQKRYISHIVKLTN